MASIVLIATLSLYGAVAIYLLMRAAGLGLTVSVITLSALFFGGILLTTWLAVRRLPSRWHEVDDGTVLNVVYFVPITTLTAWKVAPELALPARVAATMISAGFFCGMVIFIAPRLAEWARRSKVMFLGPWEPTDWRTHRLWLRHRDQCIGRHESRRVQARLHGASGRQFRRRMRRSRRAQQLGRLVSDWAFDPYSRPSAWLNVSTLCVAILYVVSGDAPNVPGFLLVGSPLVVYPAVCRWRDRLPCRSRAGQHACQTRSMGATT